MIPGDHCDQSNDALTSLRSMLTDCGNDDDVLVSLERFVTVGMRWIGELQSLPAAPDHSASCGSGQNSFFDNSTEVNVNSFSVWDSLNISGNHSLNGSGLLGSDVSVVCGNGPNQLAEVKRELEHAQSKISTLEKRLVRAEEAADVADLERNEAQNVRDQLLKRVASMDRRLSGNFNTLQKVEEESAQIADDKRA